MSQSRVSEKSVKNIYVVGLDELNKSLLQTVPHAQHYRFHSLFTFDEVVHPDGPFDVAKACKKAEAWLAAREHRADAIVGYWDFPTSTMLPILRKIAGLPSPSLESVLRLEHKFWARLQHRKFVPHLTPKFAAFDPFSIQSDETLPLSYPFWIKPIRSHSSFLGFRIDKRQAFEHALKQIRERIKFVAKPFNQIMERADLPSEIRTVDGYHCIAEEIISHARQCTAEGYVSNGRVVVYGIVDSHREGKHQSSFQRYQYPSSLPISVQEEISAASEAVVFASGYDNAPFNVEFFWDEDNERLSLLEVNARISKSHCPLFQMVDGVSHHHVMIETALGQEPHLPHRQGRFRMAAKFMLRRFSDAVVKRIPNQEDIDRLQARYPEALVRIMVNEGQRLSHLAWQDAYSFELAELFLGANSEKELLDKYEKARAMLGFDFENEGTLDEIAH